MSPLKSICNQKMNYLRHFSNTLGNYTGNEILIPIVMLHIIYA